MLAKVSICSRRTRCVRLLCLVSFWTVEMPGRASKLLGGPFLATRTRPSIWHVHQTRSQQFWIGTPTEKTKSWWCGLGRRLYSRKEDLPQRRSWGISSDSGTARGRQKTKANCGGFTLDWTEREIPTLVSLRWECLRGLRTLKWKTTRKIKLSQSEGIVSQYFIYLSFMDTTIRGLWTREWL